MSLDVEHQAVGWELLASHNPDDVAWSDLLPGDGCELGRESSHVEVLDGLRVDFLGHLSLPQFEDRVPGGHQEDVDGQGRDREVQRNGQLGRTRGGRVDRVDDDYKH